MVDVAAANFATFHRAGMDMPRTDIVRVHKAGLQKIAFNCYLVCQDSSHASAINFLCLNGTGTISNEQLFSIDVLSVGASRVQLKCQRPSTDSDSTSGSPRDR